MGPAMPPVTAFMVIVPCVVVISLPALLCHALLRNYWLANAVIWLLSLGCGFGVAHAWNFPDDHVVFGFIASLIGLATGMLLGIPFVLYRRGWLVRFWTHLLNRDLPNDNQDPQSQIVRLKEVDRRRRQRTAGMLGFWFVTGMVASLAIWFGQEPPHRDAAMFSGAVGFGLAIFFGGGLLTRFLFPKPNTG